MENKKMNGYEMAGAVLAIASSALALDVIIRKRAKKSLVAAGLLVGIAGLAASAAVVAYPRVKAIKQLDTSASLDIDEIDLMDQCLLEELEEELDEELEAPAAAAEIPAVADDNADDSIDALEIDFTM